MGIVCVHVFSEAASDGITPFHAGTVPGVAIAAANFKLKTMTCVCFPLQLPNLETLVSLWHMQCPQ